MSACPVAHRWACAGLILLACACRPYPELCDARVAAATRALDAARDDAGRAQALSDRGRGLADKARFGKGTSTMPADQAARLFDQALADHDRAIALTPGDPAVFMARGRTLYDRAALEPAGDAGTKALWNAAAADFTQVIDAGTKDAQAYDMRGLVHTALRDWDRAIADFTIEASLDARAGNLRLAETYCLRGSAHLGERHHAEAIADLERAIDAGPSRDGCDCQPDAPLVAAYCEERDYARAWDAVRRAQAAGRWLPAETLDRLRRESGRAQ